MLGVLGWMSVVLIMIVLAWTMIGEVRRKLENDMSLDISTILRIFLAVCAVIFIIIGETAYNPVDTNLGGKEKETVTNQEVKRLLATHGELVEGNTWHDNFWGDCSCGKCNKKGKNVLGKLLVKIREEFRNEEGVH